MPTNILSRIKNHLHNHADSHTFINFGEFCYLKDMEGTLRSYYDYAKHYDHAKYNDNKYPVSDSALPAIIKSPEKIPKGYKLEDLVAQFNKRYTVELNISLSKLNSIVQKKQFNYNGKMFSYPDDSFKISHQLRKRLIAVHVDIETKPGVWERAGSHSSSEIAKMERDHKSHIKHRYPGR